MINPQTKAIVILEINWDPNAVVCNCTLAAGRQSVLPICKKWLSLHRSTTETKSCFSGPMMTCSKIQSIFKKAKTAIIMIASTDLTICQRSASRCSIKDISACPGVLLKKLKAIFHWVTLYEGVEKVN